MPQKKIVKQKAFSFWGLRPQTLCPGAVPGSSRGTTPRPRYLPQS